MVQIEIKWSDLTEVAKEQIIEELGFDPSLDRNWDIFPMATIDIEEEM